MPAPSLLPGLRADRFGRELTDGFGADLAGKLAFANSTFPLAPTHCRLSRLLFHDGTSLDFIICPTRSEDDLSIVARLMEAYAAPCLSISAIRISARNWRRFRGSTLPPKANFSLRGTRLELRSAAWRSDPCHMKVFAR